MKKSFIKEVRSFADMGFDVATIATKLGKPVLEICQAIMLIDTLPAPKVKPVKLAKKKTVASPLITFRPRIKRKKTIADVFTPDASEQVKAKRFMAKPYNENFLKAVAFDSMNDAVKYLNEFSGTTMPAKDWAMVNKLFFVKSNGTIGTVVL
jgi:hypothetical protein